MKGQALGVMAIKKKKKKRALSELNLAKKDFCCATHRIIILHTRTPEAQINKFTPKVYN